MLRRIIAFAVPLALCHVFAVGQNSAYKAVYYVDGNIEKEQYRSHVTLESLEVGKSVVYATGGVKLNLTSMRLNKTSGGMNDRTHRQTGENSVVLVDDGSRVVMEACSLNTHTNLTDGVTAKGDSTTVTINEGYFSATRAGSALFNALDGGNISIGHAKINTYARQSPSFYTGPGGMIDVTRCDCKCTGQASAMIHSCGDVTVYKGRLEVSKWALADVDGGSVRLTECDLTSGDISGFLIYGAEEKSEGGQLTLIKNDMTVKEGPVFLVTNTSAEITVYDKNIIKCKSGELISVRADDWGVKGSNGGKAVLNIEKQSLAGYSYVDSISSLSVVLKKSGLLKGQINRTENREAEVRVTLEEGGKWKSKGDSYITSIVFNQPLEKGLKQLKGKHTIYYDASDPLNAPLEGKVYKTGGGQLRPM